MRCVVIGLGIQGRKRLAVAGTEAVATVDPVVADAHYQRIEDVPLDIYDAALVCTPDRQKVDILRYLLSSGKHVLVEKPMLAERSEILSELLELARQNRVACYTAYNHRFEPHLARVRELLDQDAIGRVYQVRLFYGNGTARDVRNSPWRDQGLGVLVDLGSHLLDLVLYWFGPRKRHFQAWAWNCFENRAFDHFVFGSPGMPFLELETSLLSWRNSFKADIYGEKGSLHVDCLCKWGPTSLTIRHRVLPSGAPTEEVSVLKCPDPTWKLEYDYFKKACDTAGSNLENDIWIHSVFQQLSLQVGKGLAA
ncbi:MAG: oxidoreductase [Gemmatales bacterium]|nr:MAG: oxidoreductase [Gemmatales bacterium]